MGVKTFGGTQTGHRWGCFGASLRMLTALPCHAHTESTMPRDKHVCDTHSAGDHEGALLAHQQAMRTERDNPQLWEGLGASFQGLGRTSAALKVCECCYTVCVCVRERKSSSVCLCTAVDAG